MKKYILSAFFLLVILKPFAQERPFIWVNQSEREAILQKIEKQEWAASFYKSFSERLDVEFISYQVDRTAFLKNMALNFENTMPGISPPLKQANYSKPGGRAVANVHMRYLQVGVDCGVMYYLTQDVRYAQCALDILNTFIVGINQLPLDSNTVNGGWLYTNGEYLREAREIGPYIPIIYDFVSPFIKKGGMPYDLGKMANTSFPSEQAQQVFRTYAMLTMRRGHTGSNWGVLEATAMIQNTLALDDLKERNKFLEDYLTIGSDRQDPLTVVASKFKQEGDIWPETSQYSNEVPHLTTYLLTILTHYNPALHLGQKYPTIPLALTAWKDMKYPNDEIVRFGDGHRHGETNYRACEVAYYLGKIDGVAKLVEINGTIINTAISEGKYQRGTVGERPISASVYFQPLNLLWFVDEIKGDAVPKELSRTDNMSHASLFLQRNLSSTTKPEDAMMCFVAGAPMVHGHASGMDMELYGRGQIMGVDNGRDSYGQDIHENYYRLFAAHNSVIVNGSSRSEGGWANLGINPVQLITMEPLPKEEPVSPYHSFTQTSFIDDKGDQAEAVEQRTMALIRTSPTTGYYVDVFRSKSKLPNQYHDYLYHNIGDKVEFLNSDLKLNPTPERYMANADVPWTKNRQFRHPGWHFFKDVQSSSNYNKEVTACFSVEKLQNKKGYMNMHILGNENRAYTRVMAPKATEAPAPYDKLPTPTVIIRKTGEAWKEPFVVVYEPFEGNKNNSKIVSVEKLTNKGVYKGIKVISKIDDTTLVQYIITQTGNEVYSDKKTKIKFTGTFAIVTTDLKGKVLNVYMGDGAALRYRNITIKAKNKNVSAYLDFSNKTPDFKCNKVGQATFTIQ